MQQSIFLALWSLKRTLRSRVILSIGGALLLTCVLIGYLSGDTTKATLTLSSIFLLVVPLITLITVSLDYYNNKEFTELLLAHPVSRMAVYWGQWIGITTSLLVASVAGVLLGYVLMSLYDVWLVSVCVGTLVLCFSAVAWRIAIGNNDKARGVGLALMVWLWCAIVYDGVLLGVMALLSDYPLEKFLLAFLALNPIDSIRVAILLMTDTAALMGVTGAIMREIAGSSAGILAIVGVVSVWIGYPLLRGWRIFRQSDF